MEQVLTAFKSYGQQEQHTDLTGGNNLNGRD
jgi:hypothetical protein